MSQFFIHDSGFQKYDHFHNFFSFYLSKLNGSDSAEICKNAIQLKVVGSFNKVFFGIRVFNPGANSKQTTQDPSVIKEFSIRKDFNSGWVGKGPHRK